MAKIDGGEMIVRALEREGVHEVFTLHGGHLDAIYAACMRHGFRVIDTRHEQAAAHMADGWARTTGRPGSGRVRSSSSAASSVAVIHLTMRSRSSLEGCFALSGGISPASTR